MNTSEKLNWLSKDFIELLASLSPEMKGRWGVMNAHQMVEHMSYSLRQANGKENKKLLTSSENLEKMRAFMLSDRPFKENTKNIELPEIPTPAIKSSMQESIEELKAEIIDLIEYHKSNPGIRLMNPFFGEMDFEEWIHLFHKHAIHHAKQFGLVD